jgi:hypothetical protein
MMNQFGFLILILIFVAIGTSTVFYSFSKCGVKALLLGDKAFIAAVTGMCDETEGQSN